ncbi:MAG: non-canonical purine NTP pyrophosphatase [Treponema sp.]|jgi:XTP/dITP diphosphohydrolase|nr:non-canonical purine NTP pyrophosphatase [Treponema sp.]
MTIFLASGNRHKQDEIAQIFSPNEILIPADRGIKFDPEETGATFVENSLIKARALWNIVQEPVIADDSGICVDLLDGAPGIYSARYAGSDDIKGVKISTKLDSNERNKILIEQTNIGLKAFRNKNPTVTHSDMELRSCRFVCAMVLYFGNEKFYVVQETLEGNLVSSINDSAGSGGFGYDPVVYLPSFNKTVAELSENQKNSISHRGKAGRKLALMLKQL